MPVNRRSFITAGGAAAAAIAMPNILRSTPASAANAITMQLDWKFNVQFAGLFMAQEMGLYEKAGLAVSFREWEDGMNVIDLAAASTDIITCAEQNLILSGQADGRPVKAIATMFQASPYGLMGKPDLPSLSLADLKGGTVGVHLDGMKVMQLVMGVNGIPASDVTLVDIPYAKKYDRVLSGEMVAVQCYVVDEPLGVESVYKVKPVVLRQSDFGFVSTAQTVVASDAMLAAKPDQVKAFLKVSFDGWRAALADIPAASKLVAGKYAVPGGKYTDVAYQEASLRLIADYVTMGTTMDKIGVLDPAKWTKAAEMMAQYGIIPKLPDLSKTIAGDYMAV
jgi:ABC-type nitrate/sulfonate/bicarbonate transport system substrate-binding protein